MGQCEGECRAVCQPPRAMGAARRFGGEFFAHTPFPQFSGTYRVPLPLFPYRRSQPASGPLLKTFQHRRSFAFPEIADPSPKIPGQFIGHPFDAYASGPARDFSHPLFEPLHRFRRDPPLWCRRIRKAESEKLPRPWPRHCTLLQVHPEFERCADESRDALHHPFPGPPAAHVDITVSSPGESHPEALSEPYLNLSAHTAPAMEPRRTPICHCANSFESRREMRAIQCVARRK